MEGPGFQQDFPNAHVAKNSHGQDQTPEVGWNPKKHKLELVISHDSREVLL